MNTNFKFKIENFRINFEIIRNAGMSLFEKCQFEQFDAVSTKYKEFLAKKEAAELATEGSATKAEGDEATATKKKKKKK